MINIDTSILVRIITRDDEELAKKAEKSLRQISKVEYAFVSDIVLIELFWVLRSRYNYEKNQIIIAMDRIIHNKKFSFTDRDVLDEAFELFKNGKGSFADYLINLIGKKVGCSKTLSFDVRMIKEGHFHAPV